MTPAPRRLDIDLVADMVCPWCFIGWRRLLAAAALRPEVELHVTWRPYQLDPSLPEDGVDRAAYMSRKFPDAARRKEVSQMLVTLAAEDGITLNFDRIAKSPNTSAAHRLVRWAQGQGLQAEVLEGLFAAYFTDGRDIGDPEVLADIGAAAGMDRLLILDLLARGEDREIVRQEHQIAVEAGVTGVPFMIFAQKFSVIGAEPAEKLARAIDHAFVEA
jgi:predicted DsbA family dithiol-disulfide isomerase